MTFMAMSFSDLMNFDPSVANKMSLSEKLEDILTTAVGGYLLVLMIMALIWALLEIFSKMFSSRPKLKTKLEKVKEEPKTDTVVPMQDESELVAVISAAVSAYTGKEQSSFRVVSFRKK